MRFNLACFLLAMCCYSCLAQDSIKTVFWQVTKNGTKDTSYLFGTDHEVNSSFFANYPGALQKLKQSSVLFVEEEAVNTQSAKKEQNPKIAEPFNEDKWNQLLDTGEQKIFKQFTNKAEDKSYYKQSPLSAMLKLYRLYAINFCDTSRRDSSNIIMDAFIEQQAILAHKTIRYLDEDQTKIIADAAATMPKKTEKGEAEGCAELMKYMLNEDLSGCKLMDSYKNFQFDYAFDKHNTGKPDLATERNKLWLLKLDVAFKKDRCFVAMGFRHLPHVEGLIVLLRKSGYTLTPILQ